MGEPGVTEEVNLGESHEKGGGVDSGALGGTGGTNPGWVRGVKRIEKMVGGRGVTGVEEVEQNICDQGSVGEGSQRMGLEKTERRKS